jgi:pilus assembly protein CpaE
MNDKNSFVIVSDRDDHIRWLQSALSNKGDVVVADTEALERILQIIDVTGASIVFVDVNSDQIGQQIALIEGLLAVKPLVSVVALSKSNDAELVLAVVRAGARDFVIPGDDRNQIVNLVNRLGEHTPYVQQNRVSGKLVVLANARPDSDTVMLAIHLALAAQEIHPDHRTLLLDLGIPQGDGLMYLGLKSSYSFVDTVRSLRRLDETLIESAFAEHSSGLRILDMGKDASDIRNVTSADIIVLLGTLKTYFRNIVINLGGVPQSEFLDVLLRHADQTIVVAEQSVPSVQHNMALIKRIAAQKQTSGETSLVLDRYYSKLVPSADIISRGFGIPLLATLPPCGLARLNVINSGMSMFESAPKEQYCARVRKLAAEIFNESDQEQPVKRATGKQSSWWRSICGRVLSEV